MLKNKTLSFYKERATWCAKQSNCNLGQVMMLFSSILNLGAWKIFHG